MLQRTLKLVGVGGQSTGDEKVRPPKRSRRGQDNTTLECGIADTIEHRDASEALSNDTPAEIVNAVSAQVDGGVSVSIAPVAPVPTDGEQRRRPFGTQRRTHCGIQYHEATQTKEQQALVPTSLN